ncbi:MAG TPA: aminotransferase class V-fold PLP-dependent enzyme [Salinimicrobium sp.]|nr:aminotransferase class V-fold PLP-dependent enzyme [Salinimicrobium sp.]
MDNTLRDKILELEKISQTLEPSEKQRNILLDEVRNHANKFLNNLTETKSFSSEKVTKDSFSIGPKTKSIQEILSIYSDEVASRGITAASGGHLGYIPGGGIYSASLGDYLADITNEYAGISFASPGAVAMEHEILNWMKSLFGFPESSVGNLTSGGSIANLIALTAARDKFQIKGDKIVKSVVYTSSQLHHSSLKVLRIIGLEDIIIRNLNLDSSSKIVSEDLSDKIIQDKKAGLNPFLVIGSAGTTDTGAVDPLEELGEICQSHHLWYHIDAAYGGFFILTEQGRSLLTGLNSADSLAVDPHKGMFLPFGSGAVLVRDKKSVFHSHHHSANYMQDAVSDSVIDPADVSPELTKHFRAVRLWLPLQLHGIKPFVAALKEKLLLTRYFRNKLMEKGFKTGPEPDLTVSYFWWPRKKNDEDQFNRKLLQEIHRDGTVFLSSTNINGKFVIRIAVLSFRTKLATIDKAVEAVDKARKRISQS